MNFLPLSKKDVTDWLSMASTFWPEESREDLEKLSSDLLSLAHYQCFIARTDAEETIGSIYLSLRRDYVEGSSQSPVGYIEGIYVKPEFRGRGIARELANLEEQWSREHGCTEMASDAYWDNAESREFHRYIGFNETERLVHFIKPI